MKRELTCINCPLGCALTGEYEETEEGIRVTKVSGNRCPRGEAYARTELTAPVRMFTSTLPVAGGIYARVSVKSKEPVPKGKMMACAAALRGVKVSAPIAAGDILIPDLAGTGIPLIATRTVEMG